MFELDHGTVRPEALLNLFARDGLARLLQQQFEELQRLALETVLRTVPGEHSALKVQFESAEARHG